MAEIIDFTNENFESTVNGADKPVLVDFWAVWCGPCKMQSPVFDELAEEYGDKAVFGKVNVDECEQLAVALKVQAIPTIMIIVGGEVKEVNVGYAKKEKLAELLAKYI